MTLCRHSKESLNLARNILPSGRAYCNHETRCVCIYRILAVRNFAPTVCFVSGNYLSTCHARRPQCARFWLSFSLLATATSGYSVSLCQQLEDSGEGPLASNWMNAETDPVIKRTSHSLYILGRIDFASDSASAYSRDRKGTYSLTQSGLENLQSKTSVDRQLPRNVFQYIGAINTGTLWVHVCLLLFARLFIVGAVVRVYFFLRS
ncbi:hypothetical protein R3P38DRAFT_2889367, partial [Favolaschia claudopus]